VLESYLCETDLATIEVSVRVNEYRILVYVTVRVMSKKCVAVLVVPARFLEI
jgi:hypothetical protein